MPPVKQKKRTALKELFEEEDSKLLSTQQQQQNPVSTAQRVDQEIQFYRSLPPIPTKDNASLWWWKKLRSISVSKRPPPLPLLTLHPDIERFAKVDICGLIFTEDFFVFFMSVEFCFKLNVNEHC